jgi:hypothetical protein
VLGHGVYGKETFAFLNKGKKVINGRHELDSREKAKFSRRDANENLMNVRNAESFNSSSAEAETLECKWYHDV